MPYTLKKRYHIISLVNSLVQKRNHKFGIHIPKNIKEDISLDKNNVNTLWQDDYEKDMYQVSVAFKIMQDRWHIPVGYMKASGHLIFDVKMDFTQKAQWVKNGNFTPDLEDSKYAGVVSCDIVRIELTYASLHQTQVLAADIRNAYLQAPTSENHYIICGLEFVLDNVRKIAVIVRALYVVKASGRDFWHHLQSCMVFWGFKSKGGDPDVCMRSVTQKDGILVYEYVLLYTYDCLAVSENEENILKEYIYW